MILLILIGMVVLVCVLFKALFSDAPGVVIIFIVALIAGLGYVANLHVGGLEGLWTGIKNLPAATMAYLTDSWNDFLDGLTPWGLVAFVLCGAIGFATLGTIGLLWAHQWVKREVDKLNRQLDQAHQETAHERDRAERAEQASARDRETTERAVAGQESAERRSQGLTGQLDKAVMMADKRGQENKDLRHDKKRLQDEVGELRAQLSAAQQKAIVNPLVRERRGSTKRGTRTGP